jgi:hypothetical protein
MSIPPNKPSHKWALLCDLRYWRSQAGRPAGDTYERMLWRVVQKTGLTYSPAWTGASGGFWRPRAKSYPRESIATAA